MNNDQQGSTFTDLPTDPDIMFIDHKGAQNKGLQKHQQKWLAKIGFVKKYLHQDEKILFVSSACSPMGLLEQVVTGWIIYYLKRCILIFTNERIIHIPAKQDFSFRDSIAQIKYSQLQKLSIKNHLLICQYPDGKKEQFNYLEGKTAKKIKMMAQTLVSDPAQTMAGKRTHICPDCQAELQKEVYVCSNCNLAFKSKEEAVKISWIYPGGGYFFTNHPFLGVADAIAELFIIYLIVESIDGIIKGIELSWIGLAVCVVLLLIEKAYTIYDTKHFINEYIPIRK